MGERAAQAHRSTDALDALAAPAGALALADLAAELLASAPVPAALASVFGSESTAGSASMAAPVSACPSSAWQAGSAASRVKPMDAASAWPAGTQADLFADLAIRAELDAMAQAPSVRHVRLQRFWIELMFDLVGYRVDAQDCAETQRAALALMQRRLLVPSFGSGDWVMVAARRLLQAWRMAGCPAPFGLSARACGSPHGGARGGPDGSHQGKGHGPLRVGCLADALRAVEMHRASFEASSAQLMALLQREGFDDATAQALIDQWLIYGDYLALPLHAAGFQLIVGQFPDARHMPVAPALMQLYQQQFSVLRQAGTAVQARRGRTEAGLVDLSPAFVERSLGLLTRGGHLACIMPGAWLTDGASQPLRDTLAAQWHLKVGFDLSTVDALERGEAERGGRAYGGLERGGFEQAVGLVLTRWPGKLTQVLAWSQQTGRHREAYASPGVLIEQVSAQLADQVLATQASSAQQAGQRGTDESAHPAWRVVIPVDHGVSGGLEEDRLAADLLAAGGLAAGGLASGGLASDGAVPLDRASHSVVPCDLATSGAMPPHGGLSAEHADAADKAVQACTVVHVRCGARELTRVGQPWWIQLTEQDRLAARLRLMGQPMRRVGLKRMSGKALLELGADASAAAAVLRSTTWPAAALQTLLRAGWLDAFSLGGAPFAHAAAGPEAERQSPLVCDPDGDQALSTSLAIDGETERNNGHKGDEGASGCRRASSARQGWAAHDDTAASDSAQSATRFADLTRALRQLYLPDWRGLSEAQRSALTEAAQCPPPDCLRVVAQSLGLEPAWLPWMSPQAWTVLQGPDLEPARAWPQQSVGCDPMGDHDAQRFDLDVQVDPRLTPSLPRGALEASAQAASAAFAPSRRRRKRSAPSLAPSASWADSAQLADAAKPITLLLMRPISEEPVSRTHNHR